MCDRLARRTIFISYRRSDSGGHAGRLREELARHFGNHSLFLDHDSLSPGEQWQEVLRSRLDAADVVLVVIGPDWTGATDSEGRPRLESEADWVRQEVEAALARDDMAVIPVLVGDAQIPKLENLPPTLQPLLDFQKADVRPASFKSDVRGLIRAIGGWRSHFYGVPVLAWPLLLVVVLAIAAMTFALVRRDSNVAPELPPEVEVAMSTREPVEIDLLAGVNDDDPVRLSDVDRISRGDGSISRIEGGVVTYTPANDFHGSDSFTYRVVDDEGAVAEGSVLVRVPIDSMDGDFNVAVAPFAELSSNGAPAVTERSRQMSETIFQQIDEELELLNRSDNFNFEVRGPTDMKPIEGATREERAAIASHRAADIDADVVVYGAIDKDSLIPEFFVQARRGNLDGAEELTGDYELGNRLLASSVDQGSITANAALRETLRARTRSLIQFVIGLSWYGGREYDVAAAAFELADDPAWEADDGKEILYLFLGNAAGRLGDVEQADEHYTTALELNPEFARAILGDAEVDFFRAAIVERSGDCSPGEVDPRALSESEGRYEDALVAQDRPAISNIDAKAAFGLGRVYLCSTFASIEDRSLEARASLREVIDKYEAGNDDLQTLASESLANLALIESADASSGGAEALCDAVALYNEAIHLAEEQQRADVFEANRDAVLTRLDELEHACR